MTFAQLRVLLAVVERGGFTAAADHLGMTQPAVSRAVAALEAELDAVLVARTRDGAVLTAAGHRAVEHARGALRHHDLLREGVAEAAGRVTGTLRLASFPSVTARLVPALLRTFGERHPHVTTRLFEGTDQEVRAWLDAGAAEVAVVTLPAPGLDTVPLAEDEMLAVLPPGHRLSARPSIAMRELAAEPFVMSTGGCEPIITAAARRAGARLDVAYEARETATVLAMVEAGLGVSVVPALSVHTGSPALVTRPLDPPVPRHLALAVRELAAASPAARAFLELAAAS